MEILDPDDMIKHYKGGIYKFLSWAKHTETQELLMVYRTEDGELTWARPWTMFHDLVEVDGKFVPRFSKLEL